MQKAAQSGEAALRLHPMKRSKHLRFIEVEGELGESSRERWSALLRGALKQQAEGIAVDLRGCRAIDDHCLNALQVAGNALKARGGSGVVLVVMPGSQLGLQLSRRVGEELPVLDDSVQAMLALGDRRMPVPGPVRLEVEDGVAIIAVNGEFDLASDEDFRAVLDEALALEAPLIVDLEHCSFIDSTAIGLLLRSQGAAEHGFGLVASGPQVHRVLELVGIPQYLPSFDSRLDAIRALAS